MSGNIITLPATGDPHWKAPVASAANLPSSGNTLGDARVTQDNLDIYVWNGTAWILEVAPGATPPGGANTQVQYNHLGAFAGDSGMVYNSSTHALTLTGPLAGSNLSGTNTGDVTIDKANGLSIVDQVLSMTLASPGEAGTIGPSGTQHIGVNLSAPNMLVGTSGSEEILLNNNGSASFMSGKIQMYSDGGPTAFSIIDNTGAFFFEAGSLLLGPVLNTWTTQLNNDGSATFASGLVFIGTSGATSAITASYNGTTAGIKADPNAGGGFQPEVFINDGISDIAKLGYDGSIMGAAGVFIVDSSGNVTASTYYGDGSNLTGISADHLNNGGTTLSLVSGNWVPSSGAGFKLSDQPLDANSNDITNVNNLYATTLHGDGSLLTGIPGGSSLSDSGKTFSLTGSQWTAQTGSSLGVTDGQFIAGAISDPTQFGIFQTGKGFWTYIDGGGLPWVGYASGNGGMASWMTITPYNEVDFVNMAFFGEDSMGNTTFSFSPDGSAMMLNNKVQFLSGAWTGNYLLAVDPFTNAISTNGELDGISAPGVISWSIFTDGSASFSGGNAFIGVDGSWKPGSIADAAATNGTMYYSTTSNKLVFKDSGGTVHALY